MPIRVWTSCYPPLVEARFQAFTCVRYELFNARTVCLGLPMYSFTDLLFSFRRKPNPTTMITAESDCHPGISAFHVMIYVFSWFMSTVFVRIILRDVVLC